MTLVEEAKTIGAAMAHDNANWDEGERLAGLFFRDRRPPNPAFGFGRDYLAPARPRTASEIRATWAEYQAAYVAFFDAYYRRA